MKFRLSISNYYVRNGLAYLITITLGALTFIGDSRMLSEKRFFSSLLYYTFVFIWVVIHNRILIDKLLLKRKIAIYLLCLPLAYLLWYRIALIVGKNASLPVNHSNEVFLFVIFTSLGFAISFSTRYVLERKRIYQTNLLQRNMELQQLKAQLNPHFLFNALNNIYSYTLHSNKFGNDLILKLSDLMRFILDSSEKEKIPVSNEINFIENYIAFEKERLGERCVINYSKNILYENREIAPLILFPFIENAFKYGTNSIQKTSVEIQIIDNAEMLRLTVKNSIINKKLPSTKMGLSNSSRRLELLYPGKHNLSIENTDDTFVVNLTLQYD